MAVKYVPDENGEYIEFDYRDYDELNKKWFNTGKRITAHFDFWNSGSYDDDEILTVEAIMQNLKESGYNPTRMKSI